MPQPACLDLNRVEDIHKIEHAVDSRSCQMYAHVFPGTTIMDIFIYHTRNQYTWDYLVL